MNDSNVVWATGTAVVVMPDTSMVKITEGERRPANDPVVRQHPGWFSDDPRYGLAPDDVESATAVPGERRNARRGSERG